MQRNRVTEDNAVAGIGVGMPVPAVSNPMPAAGRADDANQVGSIGTTQRNPNAGQPTIIYRPRRSRIERRPNEE